MGGVCVSGGSCGCGESVSDEKVADWKSGYPEEEFCRVKTTKVLKGKRGSRTPLLFSFTFIILIR